MKKELPSVTNSDEEIKQLEKVVEELQVDYLTLSTEIELFQTDYEKAIGPYLSRLESFRSDLETMLEKYSGDSAKRSKKRPDYNSADSNVDWTPPAPNLMTVPKALKDQYRKVVKMLHPDLVTNPKEREARNRILAEANDAYKRQDTDFLSKLILSYEKEEPMSISRSQSQVVITSLKSRVTSLRESIQEIRKSDIYELMISCRTAQNQGRNIYSEIAETIRTKIKKAHSSLRDIRESLE